MYLFHCLSPFYFNNGSKIQKKTVVLSRHLLDQTAPLFTPPQLLLAPPKSSDSPPPLNQELQFPLGQPAQSLKSWLFPTMPPPANRFWHFTHPKKKEIGYKKSNMQTSRGLVLFHNSENSHRLWFASSITLKLWNTKSITERELEVHYKKELEGSNWRKKRGKQRNRPL